MCGSEFARQQVSQEAHARPGRDGLLEWENCGRDYKVLDREAISREPLKGWKEELQEKIAKFIVVQGKLHYKCKKSGQTRMAISSEVDKERIFKVMFFSCLTVSNPAYSQSKTWLCTSLLLLLFLLIPQVSIQGFLFWMYYIQIENYSLKGTATITYVHRTCEPIDLQLGVKCMLSCDIYSIRGILHEFARA